MTAELLPSKTIALYANRPIARALADYLGGKWLTHRDQGCDQQLRNLPWKRDCSCKTASTAQT
jgi:hypothetical protein